MKWVLGGWALLAVGTLLRRILRMDGGNKRSALQPIGSLREMIFEPIALELETQGAMLAVALNDAIEERDAGRLDIAWSTVRMTASQWERLAEIINVVLDVVGQYMPVAQVVVPARLLGKQRYLSPVMFEYARNKDFVQKFIFRSKMRFQMHLWVLHKAVETLTADFLRVYSSAECSHLYPEELWRTFDVQLHDFDLLTKESLLAVRSFLMGLPDSALRELSFDLKAALPRGVRDQQNLVRK
jgi:hypothetical protein